MSRGPLRADTADRRSDCVGVVPDALEGLPSVGVSRPKQMGPGALQAKSVIHTHACPLVVVDEVLDPCGRYDFYGERGGSQWGTDQESSMVSFLT